MRHQSEIKKDETGFTLIEVIVTCCIIGIIAAVAIPSFSSLLPNYRLRLAAQELLSNFQLAKITAIKRHTNCSITFSIPSLNRYIQINGLNYVYVVYIDSNRNLEYDAGDEVIAKKQWADYNNDVEFNTSQGGGNGVAFVFNDNNLPSISFRSNGLPVDNNGNISSGTVFLRLKNNNNKTTQINLSTAGSVTITTS